jgi:hypothetical protein
MLTSSRGQEEVSADAFEQELLADIARWELKTYRAAKKQAILGEQAWAGSSALARRETPGKRRSDEP